MEGCPLAMVYAVKQQFRNINEPAVGLSRGTIFAELDLPFKAGEGGRKC
ncbi:MAG: spore coat associated protein CotJA [Clostridia bacterium]|nr:spore coat associated protein CotJA [Clostridia bacterium]